MNRVRSHPAADVESSLPLRGKPAAAGSVAADLALRVAAESDRAVRFWNRTYVSFFGISSPRCTAGRATNASSTRLTSPN
jgi:hypothetical protein